MEQVDDAPNYYVFKIITSNTEYRHIFDPDFGGDMNYWTVAVNALADMDANDTAYATFFQDTSGAVQTDIDGSEYYTYFSGCLVC